MSLKNTTQSTQVTEEKKVLSLAELKEIVAGGGSYALITPTTDGPTDTKCVQLSSVCH